MKTTVRIALEAAVNLLNSLVFEPGSQDKMVEVKMVGTRFYVIPETATTPTPKTFFDFVEWDDCLEEGDVVRFDYVDRDGDRTVNRMGIVREPHKRGRKGWLVGMFDVDKNEYRAFSNDGMSNVRLLRPTNH